MEVDPRDPAFRNPTKPIGPVYERAEAERLAEARGWVVKPDGDKWRRVVASPRPQHIPDIGVIRLLLDHDVIVICAGGGGIPVVRQANGALIGVEAVIDKDWASALLARQLQADALLLLTDVEGAYDDRGTPAAKLIQQASPEELKARQFAEGSMDLKVLAACDFVATTGKRAGIGRLGDALAILEGRKGTCIGPPGA